jgi:hypothetical protein
MRDYISIARKEGAPCFGSGTGKCQDLRTRIKDHLFARRTAASEFQAFEKIIDIAAVPELGSDL